MIRKRGQVWVETVIYTLIGLAIIGLVLAGALPKINAKKDEIVIEQSIEALRLIDDKIYEVSKISGNRRIINLEVKKGYLEVDPIEDVIRWVMDSSFEYSQVGSTVDLGKIKITTDNKGGVYEVELKLKYSLDIRFNNLEKKKQFDVAPTPYRLVVENVGEGVIDFSQV